MSYRALHITINRTFPHPLEEMENVYVLLGITFLLALFVSIAVSFSPVAELSTIGLSIVLLTVLPILQILISGIINLILIS